MAKIKAEKTLNPDIQIYQLFYRSDQKKYIRKPAVEIDRRTLPIDETSADLYRENITFIYLWKHAKYLFTDLTGILSWKFEEKSELSITNLIRWITANPGNDIYTINPFPYNEIEFRDIWHQAEVSHPGFIAAMHDVFKLINYPTELLRNGIPNEYVVYCNYWVANQKFWQHYMNFLNSVIKKIEANTALKLILYAKTTHETPVAMAAFVLERLFSCYLFLNRHHFKILKYENTLWRLRQCEKRLVWYFNHCQLLQQDIMRRRKIAHRLGIVFLWNKFKAYAKIIIKPIKFRKNTRTGVETR